MPAPMAPAQTFNDATRQKRFAAATQVSTTANGDTLTFPVPRTGIASRIYVAARATINVVTSGPNALGQAAIIKQIRLTSNLGQDIFNVSGPGYFYCIAQYLDFPGDALAQTTARAAIASAAGVVLDFIIPIAVNLRDMTGLLMLQSEQTLLTLTVQCETDANIASGGITWTTRLTVIPTYEIFTVPEVADLLPPLNVVHSIIEDKVAIAATGTTIYSWPRGNTYLQMIHGYGIAQVGTDKYNSASLRLNSTDWIYGPSAPSQYDIVSQMFRFVARLKGVLPFDLVSSTGIGVYDLLRDAINSAMYTAVETVFDANATDNLYSVRRVLAPLVRRIN